MTRSRQAEFTNIAEIVAQQVLPRLRHVRKLPLHISCIGTATNEIGGDAEITDRTVALDERPSPEEAMTIASQRVARGDFPIGSDGMLHFRPRVMVIQDSEYRLVLAGEIRSGIILWQQPVTSDTEARRIVTEASRLRGMAFSASDPSEARDLRYRAALLETRLVDSFWRETAAELLRLPQAA